MRSSIGPCGLDAQRLRAASSSSAWARSRTKIQSASPSARMAGRVYLKGGRAVASEKPEERPVYSAAYGEHLEELAHFGRRKQLLRLGSERCIVQRVLHIRLRKHIGDAAVHQELRLRGVAEHLEPRVHGGARKRGEVDVRRDVLLSRACEDIGVRAMPVMAHERSRRALRVIVLAARKAVIDDENDALFEPRRDFAHPAARDEADLAFERYRDLERLRFAQQLAAGRPLPPHELFALD